MAPIEKKIFTEPQFDQFVKRLRSVATFDYALLLCNEMLGDNIDMSKHDPIKRVLFAMNTGITLFTRKNNVFVCLIVRRILRPLCIAYLKTITTYEYIATREELFNMLLWLHDTPHNKEADVLTEYNKKFRSLVRDVMFYIPLAPIAPNNTIDSIPRDRLLSNIAAEYISENSKLAFKYAEQISQSSQSSEYSSKSAELCAELRDYYLAMFAVNYQNFQKMKEEFIQLFSRLYSKTFTPQSYFACTNKKVLLLSSEKPQIVGLHSDADVQVPHIGSRFNTIIYHRVNESTSEEYLATFDAASIMGTTAVCGNKKITSTNDFPKEGIMRFDKISLINVCDFHKLSSITVIIIPIKYIKLAMYDALKYAAAVLIAFV